LLKKLEETEEEIIIERAGKPIAKILKYKPIKSCNRLGLLKNKIVLADDFDKWPEDIDMKFGME